MAVCRQELKDAHIPLSVMAKILDCFTFHLCVKTGLTGAGVKRRVILYGGRHFRKGRIDKREGRGSERTRCDKGKGRSKDEALGGSGRV